MTSAHDASLVMPQRLAILRTQFQHVHVWSGVQQHKELIQTWDDDDIHSVAARVYQNTQKQYQTDALILGFQSEASFLLTTFLMNSDLFKQCVTYLLEKCIKDLKKDNPEGAIGSKAAKTLGQLGIKDSRIIQAVRNLLADSNKTVRGNAIIALGQLGAIDTNVIQDLRNLLGDSDWHVRSHAAEVLGNLGVKDVDVIQDLRNLLTDSDDVHSAAAKHFRQLGIKNNDVTQTMRNGCTDIIKSARINAAKALGQLGVKDNDVIQVMRNGLSDANIYARIDAASALGELGVKYQSVIHDLLHWVKDKKNNERDTAALVLAQLGAKDADVIQALRNLLTDSNKTFRIVAAIALSILNIKDPDVIQTVRNLLNDSDVYVRRSAIHALISLGIKDVEFIKTIRNFLNDSDYRIRIAAIFAVCQLGLKDSDTIKALKHLLKDPDDFVRHAAAVVLGKAGVKDPDVMHDLRNLLKDSDNTVCSAAVKSLGQLGAIDTDVIQDFQNLLKNSKNSARIIAIKALDKLSIKDSDAIQAVRHLLKDSDVFIRSNAAKTLGQLGIKNADVIQDLQNLLKDSNTFVRIAAVKALDQLGIKSPGVIQAAQSQLENTKNFLVHSSVAIALAQLDVHDSDVIQTLQNSLKDSNWDCDVSLNIIKVLKYFQALSLDACIGMLQKEVRVEIIREVYISFLRNNLEDYVPHLKTNAHPELPFLFVAALYFQGASLVQKNGQLYLGETLLDFDEEMIQNILIAKNHFIERMSAYSESIHSMSIAINAPRTTSIFSAEFLSSDLPADESSQMEQRIRQIEKSIHTLLYRVDGLKQDVVVIRSELNRIQQQMASDWENVQAIFSTEEVAYIKTFKQQLVQMYIVASVATSGDIQVCLTGTTGNVVTVLDVIAGLVPWGGGAVQMMSYLMQSIGEQVKQNRMERVMRLGSTPEEVANIAKNLGQRLLHCLEIEHYARDGRINSLFNNFKKIFGCYADIGFYGALFEAFTESGIVGVMTNRIAEAMTPPEIEERASYDAQLLLSAIMEKSVPHTQENQIDLDRLFLYSAPLLTVIDRMFIRMVTQYCDKHGYNITNISNVKYKTKFCAKLAEVCHQKASDTVMHIEDESIRNDFIENIAIACNQQNLLFLSKNSTSWGIFRPKNISIKLSINKKILEPESTLIEEIYIRALR